MATAGQPRLALDHEGLEALAPMQGVRLTAFVPCPRCAPTGEGTEIIGVEWVG